MSESLEDFPLGGIQAGRSLLEVCPPPRDWRGAPPPQHQPAPAPRFYAWLVPFRPDRPKAA